MTIQSMMIGFSEIKDPSNIILTDSSLELLNLCKIKSINEIEFINGYSFIADMLDVLSDKSNRIIRTGETFIEICLKASKANLFFKDYSSNDFEDIYTYIEQTLSNSELIQRSRKLIVQRINHRLEKCKEFISFIGKSIDELDFLPNTVKVLTANEIYTIADLISFSRDDLVKLSKVGPATVDDVVLKLEKSKLHLKGDAFCQCRICNNTFLTSSNIEDLLCYNCSNRLRRVKTNNNFSIKIELEQSSFTDGKKGFIVYADIKNNTNVIHTLSYKEAYIVCRGRQYSYNSFLSGHRWADKEDVLPGSVKTVALIWYDYYLKYDNLAENDELILVIYSDSESKTIYYKFKYSSLESDDENNSYEFVLYDVMTK